MLNFTGISSSLPRLLGFILFVINLYGTAITNQQNTPLILDFKDRNVNINIIESVHHTFPDPEACHNN